METRDTICPFCREETSDLGKCAVCGADLVRTFTYGHRQYEMRVRFANREWRETDYYLKEIVPILEKAGVTPDISEAIAGILSDAEIPRADIVTIQGFQIFSNFDTHPVLQIWCRRGDEIFDATKRYAERYGIYLHVTGPPLPRALLSQWFDHHCESTTKPQEVRLTRLDTGREMVALRSVANFPGQTCNLLEMGGLRILLDVGLEWPDRGSEKLERLQKLLRPSEIDIVILTHSHRDHVQGLRDLYNTYGCTAPIISTRASFELSVLRDRGYHEVLDLARERLAEDPTYQALQTEERTSREIEFISQALDGEFGAIIEHLVLVSYGDKLSFQDGRFEIDVIQAGHFPGAIMTLFRMGDYSVIYTGDFNLLEFEPIASCRSAIGGLRLKPDVVICDGSAADLVFPKESLTRARLYSEIMHTWRKKKTVLFLSESNMGSIVTYFAIHENVLRRSEGRIPFYFDETAWDQMCILRERKDDLALSVREKIAQHRDPFHSVMIRALESEKPHLGGIGIEEASKTPCVICIDAVLHGIISEEKFNAIKRILSDPDNLVIVAGAPRSSPAQDLVACRGHIELKSEATDRYERLETRCRVLNWDVPSHHLFNYHPDGDQLFEFFDNLMPERIVFFHRGPNNLIDIRQELAKRPYVKDHTVIHRHHPFIRLR